jgi:ribosomal protein S18 acetylase RimI-like enzyme
VGRTQELHKSNSGTFLRNSIVRDATVADAPAIGVIAVSAWRAAYAGLMDADYLESLREDREAESWRIDFESDPRALVAELDGAVLGFARWGGSLDRGAAPGVGELIELDVHPRVWRRGAGSQLLGGALARLRAAGFREATLWVVHGNARARGFYEAQGWREDGYEERHDRFRSGAIVHVVRYRIEIA